MDTNKKTHKVTLRKALVRAALSLLVAVPLPLMLLISVPFEVYAANYQEYMFALSDFFPVLIGFFFLFTFVISAAIFFLPKRAFRIVSAVLISFALMCFVQGNYLNGDMNTVGGDHIGDGVETGTAVLNLVIWVVVIAAAVVLACLKDRKNIISYVAGVLAIVLLMTQIVAPIFVAVSNEEMFTAAADKKQDFESGDHYDILTDKNLHTASTQGNVYWFIVDRFDESFALQAYEDDPDLFDGMEGFTWFQNHLARYNHTYPAVCEMLTNNPFYPDMWRWMWLRASWENPVPLNLMNELGYGINLYTEWMYSFDYAGSLPDYVENLTPSNTYAISDKVGLAMSVVEVGLYRDFPHYLKSVIDVNSSTSNEFVEVVDNEGNTQYSSVKSYDSDFSTREGKGFYFIHTVGCHDDSSPKDGAADAIREIKQINRYLDYLKKQGLYDDATIIITGDHGISHNYFEEPSLTALFVKSSGTGSGSLRISYAPTSHVNLWATVFKSEGIATEQDYGLSVFEIAEDSQHERYITSHTWGNPLTCVTYKVVGDARDFNNWVVLHELHFDKSLMD